MKYRYTIGIITLFLFSSTCFVPFSWAKEPVVKDAAAQPIYITRGYFRDICKKTQLLFALPENKNYLYSRKQLGVTTAEDSVREWSTGRPLFIPKTKEFSEFKEPVWSDISNEEARRVLPKLIDRLQDRTYGNNFQLGIDYKVQAARVDLDMNGTPEIVYRGSGHTFISMDENANDYVTKSFNAYLPNHEDVQIVLYKKEPFFFVRGMGLSDLVIFVQPFREASERLDKMPIGSECQFSSINSKRID